MSAAPLLGGRGVTLSRIAIIFLVVLGLFLLRDTWLPKATSVYDKAAAPFVEHHAEEEEHRPPPAEPNHIYEEHGPLLTDTTPPPPPSRPAPAATPKPAAKVGTNETCLELPGADKVMVMLKTGATELYQKLPTHFVTTLKCVPNFMIFSDLEQTFGDVKIYDAIAPVSKKIRQEHEDFKLYRELAKWQREGQDMSKLKGDSGWNLDKWKFMPMLHKTFETASDDIEWFVMIEADTSLSWLNLLLWLQKMDPTKPYYIGAQNLIGDTTFAHGGSGIVISRKAADILEAARYNSGKEVYDQAWETRTANSCCGDEIVALAFLAVDIPLTPGWPLIQGETISTVDFSEHHWCTPPITWHHVTPIEVDSYWQFQLDWAAHHSWATPYLYRDIFAHFLAQHVSVNRTSWNNLSKDKKFVTPALAGPDDADFAALEDYQRAAVESEEACAEACVRAEDGCVQWMFTPGRCHLGERIRLGKSDEREEEHWNCGWVQERVKAFRKRFEGCQIRWEG